MPSGIYNQVAKVKRPPVGIFDPTRLPGVEGAGGAAQMGEVQRPGSRGGALGGATAGERLAAGVMNLGATPMGSPVALANAGALPGAVPRDVMAPFGGRALAAVPGGAAPAQMKPLAGAVTAAPNAAPLTAPSAQPVSGLNAGAASATNVAGANAVAAGLGLSGSQSPSQATTRVATQANPAQSTVRVTPGGVTLAPYVPSALDALAARYRGGVVPGTGVAAASEGAAGAVGDYIDEVRAGGEGVRDLDARIAGAGEQLDREFWQKQRALEGQYAGAGLDQSGAYGGALTDLMWFTNRAKQEAADKWGQIDEELRRRDRDFVLGGLEGQRDSRARRDELNESIRRYEKEFGLKLDEVNATDVVRQVEGEMASVRRELDGLPEGHPRRAALEERLNYLNDVRDAARFGLTQGDWKAGGVSEDGEGGGESADDIAAEEEEKQKQEQYEKNNQAWVQRAHDLLERVMRDWMPDSPFTTDGAIRDALASLVKDVWFGDIESAATTFYDVMMRAGGVGFVDGQSWKEGPDGLYRDENAYYDQLGDLFGRLVNGVLVGNWEDTSHSWSADIDWRGVEDAYN